MLLRAVTGGRTFTSGMRIGKPGLRCSSMSVNASIGPREAAALVFRSLASLRRPRRLHHAPCRSRCAGRRGPQEPDQVPRASALRTLDELRRNDLLTPVRSALDDTDDMCRFLVSWSAVILGDRGPALDMLMSVNRSLGSSRPGFGRGTNRRQPAIADTGATRCGRGGAARPVSRVREGADG